MAGKKQLEGKGRLFTMHMEDDLLAELSEQAKAEGTTSSALIRAAVREAYGEGSKETRDEDYYANRDRRLASKMKAMRAELKELRTVLSSMEDSLRCMGEELAVSKKAAAAKTLDEELAAIEQEEAAAALKELL